MESSILNQSQEDTSNTLTSPMTILVTPKIANFAATSEVFGESRGLFVCPWETHLFLNYSYSNAVIFFAVDPSNAMQNVCPKQVPAQDLSKINRSSKTLGTHERKKKYPKTQQILPVKAKSDATIKTSRGVFALPAEHLYCLFIIRTRTQFIFYIAVESTKNPAPVSNAMSLNCNLKPAAPSDLLKKKKKKRKSNAEKTEQGVFAFSAHHVYCIFIVCTFIYFLFQWILQRNLHKIPI